MIDASGDRSARQARIDRAIAAARALRAGGRSEAQDALSIALERLIADAASRADQIEHPAVETVHRRGMAPR